MKAVRKQRVTRTTPNITIARLKSNLRQTLGVLDLIAELFDGDEGKDVRIHLTGFAERVRADSGLPKAGRKP